MMMMVYGNRWFLLAFCPKFSMTVTSGLRTKRGMLMDLKFNIFGKYCESSFASTNLVVIVIPEWFSVLWSIDQNYCNLFFIAFRNFLLFCWLFKSGQTCHNYKYTHFGKTFLTITSLVSFKEPQSFNLNENFYLNALRLLKIRLFKSEASSNPQVSSYSRDTCV